MILSLSISDGRLTRDQMMTNAWKWTMVYAHLVALSFGDAASTTPAAETCVAFESSYHIERACQCIVYESYGRSEGTFNSANFPLVYPVGVSCILYTFMADLDEIVELTFLYFDLQLPQRDSCSDSVKLYLDLDRPELGDHQTPNYVLCGNISSTQKTYYSSKRSLILEFHTDLVQGNNTGFKGVYRFLDGGQFQASGGKKRPGSLCTYDFQSIEKHKSGRFFSPKYPQVYPPSSECHYYFYGELDERVEVKLTNVQLKTNTAGSRTWCSIYNDDVITVRDGIDASSPVLRQVCASGNVSDILSSGENASVHFTSTGYPGKRQGFAAVFKFIHKSVASALKLSTKPKTNTDPTKADPIADSPNTNPFVTAETPSDSKCEFNFPSVDGKKSGDISPKKPHAPEATCRYIFQGQDHERVQISFSMAARRQAAPASVSDQQNCEEEPDLLTVSYVNSAGDIRTIYAEAFCSTFGPSPMIMSPGNRLVVTFSNKAFSSVTNSSQPMHAYYSFRSDFGITTGEQVGKGCRFVFLSNRSTSGYFASPNFGGLYPQNTECHYLFFGNVSERVNVTFVHFDVEGIPPDCSERMHSDYVEVSNFNILLTDRKMTRMCGGLKHNQHNSFLSDGNFFRVTFRTNDLYDATGFKASYHFRRAEDTEPNPKALSSNTTSSAKLPLHLVTFLQSLLIVLLQMSFVRSRNVLLSELST